jgi:hypothetical protein
MSQHNIRSQSLSSAAPLPRAWLDTIAPGVRAAFGIVFLIWSWASTIIIAGWVLEPLIGNRSLTGIAPDRFVAGFLLAFFVSIVEFVSAGRWPGIYWPVLLLLDASFTAWQTHTWLLALVSARVEVSAAGGVALWLASLVGGIIAAIFGELLLFGRRRR